MLSPRSPLVSGSASSSRTPQARELGSTLGTGQK